MSSKDVSGKLIPAVGYLRKSTKGERDGRQKQEKSIGQQKAEIIKLASSRFQILKWFEDEGVSGWKRGGERPDFQRMLEEVHDLGAQAIACDNIDRFSRAAFDEVQEDANALRKAGVRWIITASHGEYDLGARFDIASILKFTVSVWAACEYSRQLGRRIVLARRNAAAEGKRSGGFAAYGLENDGKGGLKHGDPREVRTVQWVFDQFANHGRSVNWIAGNLNDREVPAPAGECWYPKTVARLLRRKCYRGDFTYNLRPQGQFFGIDADGEATEKADIKGPGKVFRATGVYTPLVDPDLFDKAQRRLSTLSTDRSRRKRAGFALTGVLVCDHCGERMYGTCQHGSGKARIYRCSANVIRGRGACGHHQVREDAILPFVMRMLGKELDDLRAILTVPPDELRTPQAGESERRQQANLERDKLVKKIDKAVLARIESDDQRTRQHYDRLISQWRDELEQLDAELDAAPTGAHCVRLADGTVVQTYSDDELAALTAWWDEYFANAVSVPVDYLSEKHKLHPMIAMSYQDKFSEEAALLIEPRKVNDALFSLGAEVRLRWKTEKWTSSAGNERTRHVLVRGRFRLGQQRGKVPRRVLGPSGRSATSPAGRWCRSPCSVS